MTARAPNTLNFLPRLLPLARTHRLVFIGKRGSDRSQRLQDTSLYTVETIVEDVEDVRLRLNLGKISLLGHSYGGGLAGLRPEILAKPNPPDLEQHHSFGPTKESSPGPREGADASRQVEAAH